MADPADPAQRPDSDIACKPRIAFFSMEIGVDDHIPTYSGGLGVLAGDMLRSCADLGIPIAGITLLSEKGYFHQEIDRDGNQVEEPVDFNVPNYLVPLPAKTSITIEGREVAVRIWRYVIEGSGGHRVPVYFLDADVPENGAWDRTITQQLYGGDARYRLAQEIVLGVGGVRAMDALQCGEIEKYHMNEGHSALLVLELFRRLKDTEQVRRRCIFTTHTPVASGHDQFDLAMARAALGDLLPDEHVEHVLYEGKLNMTRLALHFSHHVNGVAKKHGEISRLMFPGYSIDSITNGVHSSTWTSEPFKRLFDAHMPGWRSDPYILRSAFGISKQSIWDAHMAAKRELVDWVNTRCNAGMSYDAFTIGYARRQTAYKRPELLVSDVPRLKRIADVAGPIQVIYAGKAHPKDAAGKEAIRRIVKISRESGGSLDMKFIPNYDMTIGKMMVAGVDLWLNTPRRPLEASGTSGMKAAHNGVPQFSTLDGWWLEGCIENITGWAIGPEKTAQQESDDDVDRRDLYEKLEKIILPKFYRDRDNWVRTMRSCIAVNASFFNTHRMVQQYVVNCYFI